MEKKKRIRREVGQCPYVRLNLLDKSSNLPKGCGVSQAPGNLSLDATLTS